MWLFIIKLTILKSGECIFMNAGHLQVNLNINIEIYVTSIKRSIKEKENTQGVY